MNKKSVFISYRRDHAGKWFARSIKQALQHEGYNVFLDVESTESGPWSSQILKNIPEHAHFLLLLSPGALEKCADPTDMVRQEFEYATKHKRNIVPVVGDLNHVSGMQQASPPCMHGVFNCQIAEVRHESFIASIQDLIRRFIPPHIGASVSKMSPITGLLERNIERLHVSDIIRQSIQEVLEHKDFPCKMAISGTLFENPSWREIAEAERRALVGNHPMDSSSALQVFHGDMFLIRRDRVNRQGELFHYWSEEWRNWLFPFRKRTTSDTLAERHRYNANHLEGFWKPTPSSAIKVSPVPETHFMVSLKQNLGNRGLCLYVFEFCTVTVEQDNSFLQKMVQDESPPWFSVDDLRDRSRNDKDLVKANGDVILAIHEKFGITLQSIPNSFPMVR